MSITNGYCTLDEMKSWQDLPASSTTHDISLEVAIEAASRAIDDYCNRRFYTTSSDETRYYTPMTSTLCFTDDIISITTLKTDEDRDGTYEYTWQTTDYHLIPYNASPYFGIETSPYGNYWFSSKARKSVQIVGKFGYSSTTPANIKQACLIWASRLWKRRDAQLGISGTEMFGQIKLILDFEPDVRYLLAPYRKVT